MMANPNPRQSQKPLTAEDFMLLDPSLSQNDNNITRRPIRKAPVVKEMINQVEENIRKIHQNQI